MFNYLKYLKLEKHNYMKTLTTFFQGIFLIGGEERKDEFDISGIFIKSILPGGLASIDG